MFYFVNFYLSYCLSSASSVTRTFTRRIKQSCLETNVLDIRKVLLYRDLHTETGVWIHVRQTEEIGGSDEEVPMESMNAQAACTSYSHHRLETDLPAEITPQYSIESLCVLRFRSSKQWKVVYATSREFAHTRWKMKIILPVQFSMVSAQKSI